MNMAKHRQLGLGPSFWAAWLVAIVGCVALSTCSGDDSKDGNGGNVGDDDGGGDDDNDGNDDDGGGDDGADDDGTSSFGTDPVCDATDFNIMPQPVSLMILLDRSSSMINLPEEAAAGSKRWDIAVSVLKKVLTTWTNPYIQLGLDLFPDGSGRTTTGIIADCGVTAKVAVDCAKDNAPAIIKYLDDLPPPEEHGNMTPMWCGLDMFNDPGYTPGCRTKDLDPYVVLVTDGSDTCDTDCMCADTPDTCGDPDYGADEEELGSLATELLLNDVKTFVIGYSKDIDLYKLNAIVANGGTVFKELIPADNEEQLLAAFDQIAEAVVPCSYDIAEPSAKADPNKVNFYFDGTVVPGIDRPDRCGELSGWSWVDSTHDRMQFCGTYCSDLKKGKVKKISAAFGCPTVPVV